MDDWKPIETAPHDRTWFLARTAWGAMRFVHFADDCDRYPISHDGECWPTPPIEWCAVNIPDLVAALRRVTAERDTLKATRDQLIHACGEDAVAVEELRAEVARLKPFEAAVWECEGKLSDRDADVARLTEAQKEASEAWPAVLALIREYDEAFPYAEGESDDAIVTRMNKAVSALNGGKTDD